MIVLKFLPVPRLWRRIASEWRCAILVRSAPQHFMYTRTATPSSGHGSVQWEGPPKTRLGASATWPSAALRPPFPEARGHVAQDDDRGCLQCLCVCVGQVHLRKCSSTALCVVPNCEIAIFGGFSFGNPTDKAIASKLVKGESLCPSTDRRGSEYA